MSSYEIKPHTFLMAKKLGVQVKPSHNIKKKIDVFDLDGNYICSVGDAKNYLEKDFPSYLEKGGQPLANERRRLYHIRHRKNGDVIGSKQYYALRLLW